MEIQTRDFRIEDYDAAIELWQRVEGLDVAEGDDRETIQKFLGRNPGLSRVVSDGSTIIGAALCGHDGRRGYIYHLAVDAAYRGQGLARRLIDECVTGLKRAGLERVNILVDAENLAGLEFWRRSGWERLDGAVPMARDTKKKREFGSRK
jgi:N-acetylglutamate synthase